MVTKSSQSFDDEIDCYVIDTTHNDPSHGSTRAVIEPPWPMFMGNERHTGLSIYDTSDNPGKLKWKFKLGGRTDSSPAIGADGTIYIGCNDKKIYAINPNGTLKWTFDTNYEPDELSPAIGSDGTIYFANNDYDFYAINPDGTLKWNSPITSRTGSSPTIGPDGTIYFGTWGQRIYALNTDGTKKWTFSAVGDTESSPAIAADGTVYFGSDDEHLYALYPNGTQKWRFRTTFEIISSPSIGSDGTVYIGTRDTELFAINPDGTKKWQIDPYYNVKSTAAIGADGTIYLSDNYAFYPNGTLKWHTYAPAYDHVSPAIGSDGTIFFGSWDHNLYAVRPDGTVRWKYKANDSISSSPAIGRDGTVYFGCRDNCLYAIGTAPPSPPRDLYAIEGDECIKLRWEVPIDDGSVPLKNYKIYRATSMENKLEFLKSIGRSKDYYYDYNIDPKQTYHYYVTAINDIGESAPSNEVYFPIPKLADSQWPIQHGNIQRTGLSPYNTTHNDGVLKWSYTTDTRNRPSPVIAPDGTVYFSSYDKNLYAFDPNGTLKWKFRLGEMVITSPAIAKDGTIYLSSPYDELYALNPNGVVKWEFTTRDNNHFTSPVIDHNGIIYFGSSKGNLYALYPNGTLKWIFGGWDELSPPSIGSDGTIYSCSINNRLYAVFPNGTLKWEFEKGSEAFPPVIGDDDTIYIVSYGVLYALYPNGTLIWQYDEQEVKYMPAIGKNNLIYFTSKLKLIGLYPSNGTVKHEYSISQWFSSPLTISNDGTFFGGAGENLYAINPDGTGRWYLEAGDRIESPPAIDADGSIYFCSDNGKFYCLWGLGKPKPPRNLTAVYESNRVKLTWETPLDDGGSAITGYQIYRSDDYRWISPLTEIDTPATSYYDSTISVNETYYYAVAAINDIGKSRKSIKIKISTQIPEPPHELEITTGIGYIDLSWDHPEKGWDLENTEYKIYKGTSSDNLVHLDSVNGSTTYYRDNTTSDGKVYYHISTLNFVGESEPSNKISVFPLKIPSPPENLAASFTDDYVVLSWNPPDDLGGTEILEYRVYKGRSSSNLTFYKSIKRGKTSFSDANVEPEKKYFYYVTAVNEVGESEPCQIVEISKKGEMFNSVLIAIALIFILIVIILLIIKKRKSIKTVPSKQPLPQPYSQQPQIPSPTSQPQNVPPTTPQHYYLPPHARPHYQAPSQPQPTYTPASPQQAPQPRIPAPEPQQPQQRPQVLSQSQDSKWKFAPSKK